MRRPLIIANWKMNTTLSDAMVITTSVKNKVSDLETEVVLCPPFTWIVTMSEMLAHRPGNLHLGAQNMWFEQKGAMTGEISPLMLKDFVDYVIIGHSERREHFRETDELINDKVQAALTNGIKPVLCISEDQKNDAKTVSQKTLNQLREGLRGVDQKDATRVAIAFEPVWAISTTPGGKGAASGAYVAHVLTEIREYLKEKYGEETSEEMLLLYGGSVDSKNITEFIYQPQVDGALVGGASLKSDEFIEICRKAAGLE